MKKIILTGGGSAGHVTPNLALLPALKADGFEIHYIGAADSIEQRLAEDAGLPFHVIRTGKLRRGRKLISKQNAKDIMRAMAGVSDAKRIIRRIEPDIIFSKGGFVGLPVALAAKRCRIPLVLHESDMTSGLANRLSIRYAAAVCASFPETMANLPNDKARLTGNPIRAELLHGNAARGRAFCGFTDDKPVLLVTGGSLGAERLNKAVIEALPSLLEDFNVIHLCGKGKTIGDAQKGAYAPFEFVSDEMPDILAAANVVISRGGANALNEFLAVKKPALLVPLSRATRGDQIDNAKSFEARGFSMVLSEEELMPERLVSDVKKLYAKRAEYVSKMAQSPLVDGVSEVMGAIAWVLKADK